MAKKTTTKSPAAPKAKTAQPAKVTAVRNTAVPPKSALATKPELTHDLIARRAFEIHASGQGGSEYDNWYRAETQLRAEFSL